MKLLEKEPKESKKTRTTKPLANAINTVIASVIAVAIGGASVKVIYDTSHVNDDKKIEQVCGETAKEDLFFGDPRGVIVGNTKLTVGGQLNKPHDPSNPSQGGEFYIEDLTGVESKKGPIKDTVIVDSTTGTRTRIKALSGRRLNTQFVIETICQKPSTTNK